MFWIDAALRSVFAGNCQLTHLFMFKMVHIE
jgi:hypothetical protein